MREDAFYKQIKSQKLQFATIFSEHMHAQMWFNFHFHLCNVEKAWTAVIAEM